MRNKGFTLIELVIVITMIGVIAGFSLSLFMSINGGRNKQKGADDLVTMINQARSYSLSQVDKCASGTISSYQVVVNSPVNSCYSLVQNCVNPASSVTLDTNCLPNGITFVSNTTFSFSVQGGTISSTSVKVGTASNFITVGVDDKGIITAQ